VFQAAPSLKATQAARAASAVGRHLYWTEALGFSRRGYSDLAAGRSQRLSWTLPGPMTSRRLGQVNSGWVAASTVI